MAEFSKVIHEWGRMCNLYTKNDECINCPMASNPVCGGLEDNVSSRDIAKAEADIMAWAAEHPEPVYETWFEYLLRIGVIPVNAPAGGEYQWIVESIKHKHISNDIAESLKLHPKEVQS